MIGSLMSEIQNLDVVTGFFDYQVFHTFCKGAGISDGSAFLDTGSESDGIRPSFQKFSDTQGNFFARASSAVDETDNFNFLCLLEGTGFFTDGSKICSSWAVIFCLHTSDNTYFHGEYLLYFFYRVFDDEKRILVVLLIITDYRKEGGSCLKYFLRKAH